MNHYNPFCNLYYHKKKYIGPQLASWVASLQAYASILCIPAIKREICAYKNKHDCLIFLVMIYTI
jgi:hypothetical protein